jgi:hypothetical protein
MGQPLYQYQPPTGYPDTAEQWVNTGALLERLNFGLALSSNRIQGTAVDLNKIAKGIEPSKQRKVLDRAIEALLAGDVSDQTRAILDKQLLEGLPVKGELGAGTESGTDGEMDSMMAPQPDTGRPVNRAARRDQRVIRDWNARYPQLAAPAVSPDLAKVFAMVLGSPEFQRR